MMAANALRLVEAAAPGLTLDAVNERIQVYVDRGEYPMLAAERVIRDLCREGRSEDLLALIGPPALYEAWAGGQPRRSATPALTPGAERTREYRRRLETLRATGSRLDALVQVDGTWSRLGDLDRAGCLAAARSYKRRAISVAARSRYYHAIAQQLGDGQKVRDVLDEDALDRLLTEASR